MLINVLKYPLCVLLLEPVSRDGGGGGGGGAVTLHQSSITNDNVTWPTQQHHSPLPRVLASVR